MAQEIPPIAIGQSPQLSRVVTAVMLAAQPINIPESAAMEAGAELHQPAHSLHTHNISGTSGGNSGNTSSSGSGDSQNLQPYITVYRWIRVL